MTVKELYEWAVKNDCENNNLLIEDFEGTAWKINENMLTNIRYVATDLNKVVIQI